MAKLEGFSKTLSAQMDGYKFKMVLEMFSEEDEISNNDQHPYYLSQHQILKRTKELNSIQTSIYTLTYDSTAQNFFFGITSSEEPFFRHEYKTFPKELLTSYTIGGTIAAYKDDNGVWLSAFSPIHDGAEIIGVVVVDISFEEFIATARRDLLGNIAISLLIFLLIIIILFRLLNSILKEEDKRKRIIKQKNDELIEKNEDITSSLVYAKRIQDAMLPSINSIKSCLNQSFVFYKPRDIVSGDFYWMKKKGNELYIACADCTGHGVPGAIVSVICSNALDRAVNQLKLSEPSVILDKTSYLVQEAFEKSEANILDGMDICFCKINLETKKMSFSGAYNSLYLVTEIGDTEIKAKSIHNDQFILIEHKVDKQSIGKSSYEKKPFTQKEIELGPNDSVYLFSDGYADQFGGPKGKKFQRKIFKELLLSVQGETMNDQLLIIERSFEDWKQNEEQVDDICVIGFRV
ncbi:MAG: SpoIIE family protein phosphatase [Flavobacteriales bacterium]|nr:SpoIIE family protein phosphatase [Flavobacteriales bacterium]